MGMMNLPWSIALMSKIYEVKTGFARFCGKVGELITKYIKE